MKNKNLTEFVETSLLIAIIFLLTFVPNIGYIPTPLINITIIHIPVIIGSVILGPKKGAILGLAFGVSSFIKNTFFPSSAMALFFSPLSHISVGYYLGALYSLVICFVPRILVGVLPYYGYVFLKKKLPDTISLFVSGILGSMTNTILVMGLIGVLFNSEYAKMLGEKAVNGVFYLIGVTIATNGVAEAVAAAIFTAAIAKALFKVKKSL
ncbi:MAG: ECF transporter S component [Ruminococcaceae bacterium]|nr:ECF transporter S component [Oscillospiraceae bacterium]